MRPRVFPAEDGPLAYPPGRSVSSFNEAAGIPRGRPQFYLEPWHENGIASMRPRVFPAEDPGKRPDRDGAPQCFNEAAGIPRGRRPGRRLSSPRSGPCFNEAAGIPRGRQGRLLPAYRQGQHASMRPRVFPAEDVTMLSVGGRDGNCFNEAAGIPRGRRGPVAVFGGRVRASMRPRVFPAEDDPLRGATCPAPHASMRPRVFPAEDTLFFRHRRNIITLQ